MHEDQTILEEDDPDSLNFKKKAATAPTDLLLPHGGGLLLGDGRGRIVAGAGDDRPSHRGFKEGVAGRSG